MDNPYSGLQLDPQLDATDQPVTPSGAIYSDLSLEPLDNNGIVVDPHVADERAARAHYGLGPASPGKESMKQAIMSGQESTSRQDSANRWNQFEDTKKMAYLIELAKAGNVNPDTLAKLIPPASIPTDIVWEHAFAKKYVDDFTRSAEDPNKLAAPVRAAVQEDPDRAEVIKKGAETIVERQAGIDKINEDLKARFDKMGYASTAWNMAKGFIPLVSATTTSPDWNPKNIMFPGSSIENEITKLWSFRNTPEALKWYESRVRQIEASNPYDAMAWTHAMSEQSRRDEHQANLFALMDADFAGSALAPAVKAGLAAAGMKRFMKDGVAAVKAPSTAPLKMDEVAAAKGDMQTAATLKGFKFYLQDANPSGMTVDLTDRMPTLWNPALPFQLGKGQLATESANRVALQLKADAARGAKITMETPRASRFPDELNPIAMETTANSIYRDIPKVQDTVHDVGIFRDKGTNAKFVEIKIFGPDGSVFKTEQQGVNFAEHQIGIHLERYSMKSALDADIKDNRSSSRIVNDASVEGLEGSSRETPSFTKDFTTAKGSRYKVNPDGTTTRVKAKRSDPGHEGDFGPKPTSQRTVYVTKEQANALAPPSGGGEGFRWRIGFSEGKIHTFTRDTEHPWGRAPEQTNIDYSTKPGKGLIPLELWGKKKLFGAETYNKAHFGNEITDMTVNTGLMGKDGRLEVVPHGEGYYLSIIRPVDETDPTLRKAILTTTNKNPDTVWTWLLGKFRSADDLLSEEQRANRNIVVNATKPIERYMRQEARKVAKNRTKELDEVLDYNRDYAQIIDGKQVRGKAFRTQEELEKVYMDMHKRLPTERETYAYYKYHQLMDFDYLFRNLGVHRDLLRQGIELYETPFKDLAIKFPGKTVADLPWTDGSDFGFVVINKGKEAEFHFKTNLGKVEDSATIKELREGIKNGIYKVIQVANPTDHPFKEHTGIGNTVNFAVVREFKSQPLPMNIVDYMPGVHVLYPYSNKVGQPAMYRGEKGRLQHYGDITLFGTHSRKEAKLLASQMEKVRQYIKDNPLGQLDVDNLHTKAGLDNLLKDTRIPNDADYWYKQFDPVNGRLSLHDPFTHINFNESSFKSNPKLTDHYPDDQIYHERESPYNMFRSINMDFMADRDGFLMNVVNKGTLEKPLWKMERAEALDPYAAMYKTLNNSIRTLIGNDYKIGAIEQFIAQYAHLAGPNAALLRANPFSGFYNWDQFVKASNTEEVRQSKNVHDRITGFLGAKSELGQDISLMNQRLMDLMGEKGARYYDTHELRFIKDPVAFTRAVMFQSKFGFFNPAQFLIQANGFTHLIGVTLGGQVPTSGYNGFVAYWLQRRMAFTDNPAVLNRFAKIAAKMGGWTEEQFLESYHAMRKSGYDIIGRENSLRNDSFDPALWRNSLGHRFLAAGETFFNEGEKLVAMMAWNAAYYEWRTLNKFEELTDRAIGKIQVRADTLRGNMTKASASGLQEGFPAIMTQFYTFNQRMIEQFAGKRLTGKEKITALLTHSAMYGAPVALGTAIPWPFYDSIKEEALKRGVNVDNVFYKTATEGLAGQLVYWITGKEFNIATRYGAQLGDRIKNVITGDESFMHVVTGASGTFVMDGMKSFYPFYTKAYNGLFGKDDSFPLVKEDYLNFLKLISTYSNADKAYYAATAGVAMTKNGQIVDAGLDAKDAGALMLGLTNQKIPTAFLKLKSLKSQEDVQKNTINRAADAMRTAVKALADEDYATFDTYFARSKIFIETMADATNKQQQEMFKKEIAEMRSLADSIDYQFATRGYSSQIPARTRRFLGMEEPK